MRHDIRKSHLVLAQDCVLDECLVVLLVHGYKHSHNIPHKVGAAFGHAVEKQWFTQSLLREVRVQRIEIIPFGNDSRH
jgi:hypothetical protein